MDFVNKFVATLAFLFAGGWAFFHFVRFRTLKKRVEFSFDWKASPTEGSSIVGILTVKLKNTCNTEIEIRKDVKDAKDPKDTEDGSAFAWRSRAVRLCWWLMKVVRGKDTQVKKDFRCSLKWGLVYPNQPGPNQTGPNLTLGQGQLSTLGYIFKPHARLEPGETIDDAIVLFFSGKNASWKNAVAIQFYALVRPKTRGGKPGKSMSSMVGFPMALKSVHFSTCSEDEQDEYDEITDVREGLSGWIGEAQRIVAQGLAGAEKEQLSKLIEEGSSLIQKLATDRSKKTLDSARSCQDGIQEIVGPLLNVT